jgi:hypothetical protein
MFWNILWQELEPEPIARIRFRFSLGQKMRFWFRNIGLKSGDDYSVLLVTTPGEDSVFLPEGKPPLICSFPLFLFEPHLWKIVNYCVKVSAILVNLLWSYYSLAKKVANKGTNVYKLSNWRFSINNSFYVDVSHFSRLNIVCKLLLAVLLLLVRILYSTQLEPYQRIKCSMKLPKV